MTKPFKNPMPEVCLDWRQVLKTGKNHSNFGVKVRNLLNKKLSFLSVSFKQTESIEPVFDHSAKNYCLMCKTGK